MRARVNSMTKKLKQNVSVYHSENPEIQSLNEQSKKYAEEVMLIVDHYFL